MLTSSLLRMEDSQSPKRFSHTMRLIQWKISNIIAAQFVTHVLFIKHTNALKMSENKMLRICLFNDVVSSSDNGADMLGEKLRVRISLPTAWKCGGMPPPILKFGTLESELLITHPGRSASKKNRFPMKRMLDGPQRVFGNFKKRSVSC
jgi:hypothetical protein